MASEDSINVGTFASHREDGRAVPTNIVGKHIWYSHSKEYFIVTDEDNKAINTFNYHQFKKYVDAGVISYMNPGVKQHMMEVLDEAIESGKATEDQEIPDIDGKPKKRKAAVQKETQLQENYDYEDDYYAQNAPSPEMESGYAEYNQQIQAKREKAKKPPKDPTRRLGWFFAVTFIIAAAIAIVMVFFPSLLQQAANILPH